MTTVLTQHPPIGGLRCAALVLLIAAGQAACSGARSDLAGITEAAEQASGLHSSVKPEKSDFANAAALADFEGAPDDVYRLGPGDQLRVDVWGRPELSGEQVVGPDGRVTLPIVGPLRLIDMSAEQASEAITRVVAAAYVGATATVSISHYSANRVLVLGRVSNPGVLQFETPPRILDVISRAGGLPVGGVGADKAALTRCAVFRGRDKVVWIDLKSVLTGRNLALNIRLKRDDIVYVPDANDQLVYVLGYVTTPGAYTLTPDMSFLDALAQAGGPTADAAPTRLKLVRPSKQFETDIDMKDFLAGDPSKNYALEEGDILYVPSSTMAKVGYVLQKISPVTSMAAFGMSAMKGLP